MVLMATVGSIANKLNQWASLKRIKGTFFVMPFVKNAVN